VTSQRVAGRQRPNVRMVGAPHIPRNAAVNRLRKPRGTAPLESRLKRSTAAWRVLVHTGVMSGCRHSHSTRMFGCPRDAGSGTIRTGRSSTSLSWPGACSVDEPSEFQTGRSSRLLGGDVSVIVTPSCWFLYTQRARKYKVAPRRTEYSVLLCAIPAAGACTCRAPCGPLLVRAQAPLSDLVGFLWPTKTNCVI
jgi:hypothetical protein